MRPRSPVDSVSMSKADGNWGGGGVKDEDEEHVHYSKRRDKYHTQGRP